MKLKFSLSLAALLAFMAVPVFAQHGGHGGGGGGDSMHGSSMHGDSHDGSGSGDHGKDADGDHGSGRGSSSSHGNFAAKLANNTQLSAKLQALLPPGTNLQTAAQGFKNLGQFVAAVHVAKNLGIPFDQLKATMTGPPPEKLGQAIHTLDPSANAKAALKTAEKQAHQDMESTEHDKDKQDAHDTDATHDANDPDAH